MGYTQRRTPSRPRLPFAAHFLHSCAIDVFIRFKQSSVIQCLDVNKLTRSRTLSMCKNQQQTVFCCLLSCIYTISSHIHFMYFECKLSIKKQSANRFKCYRNRIRESLSRQSNQNQANLFDHEVHLCRGGLPLSLSLFRSPLISWRTAFLTATANPSMSAETDCSKNHVRNCNSN